MTAVAGFQTVLRRVRLLVLDVDGVLTDGRLFYGPKGELLKAFHVRDGYGIKQVANIGIAVAILSGRKSAAVSSRARELGIRHVIQGADDKLVALRKLAKANRLSIEECACVGDDTPDAPVLAAAGLGIAVADAHPDALAAADLVTTRPGGHGAVREVCDWLTAAHKVSA
ncbi:MAG TPA: HAD hydrolase family protein [Steroidobacteraceae bacterium]|nr:HAD hydrolase family protein [Steroidobacteraceae bacterium]